jgi:WD40 repeat protein
MGVTADNASIDFSRKGDELAFSSGGQAVVWNFKAGVALQKWELQRGLSDCIDFRPDNSLRLFRIERGVGIARELDSQTGRVRILWTSNLLDGNYPEKSGTTPDGSFLVVEGDLGTSKQRVLKVVEQSSGQVVWNRLLAKTTSGELAISPDGRHFVYRPTNGETRELIEFGTWKSVKTFTVSTGAISQEATRFLSHYRHAGDAGTQFGISLFEQDKPLEPRITLSIDARQGIDLPTFSSDGNSVGWGTADSEVFVCDLPALREELLKSNLAW